MPQSDDNYEEELVVVLSSLQNLLERKHHDYGTANMLRHGMFGIMVRLSDKLARLEHLVAVGEQHVVDESVDDTLFDIAGYAVQALLLRKGKLK